MDVKTQARALLPNIPDDVYALWFDGRINANGWPPIGAAWRGVLRSKSIDYWKNLQWRENPQGISCKNSPGSC